ncbi:MAG: amidohydrolase [Lentisphaeria bacterium]|nr:amidohydrolase [Lentisphaeria bacterium]
MNTLLLKDVLLDGRMRDILIENTQISRIGNGIEAPGAKIINGAGHLAAVVPFYNTHTHTAMTLLRGYADDLALFTWLNEHIWPAEAKMDAHDIYAGTRLGILEMIKSGCCFFNEMYWFPHEAVRAAGEMGVRADIGLVHLALPGSTTARSAAQIREDALALAKELPAGVRIALAPHAIYTVCESALRDVTAVAEELQMPLHIHCSETLREVEDCRREHNDLSPVAYLDSVGVLKENTLLAHCVHLTDDDRKIIAGTGAVISHCPVSNMKLCSGTFDLQAALGAGCRVTIGTDGASSNNNLSMLEEMKFAALAAKLKSDDPTAGKDEDIYRCATLNGAAYAGVNAGIAEGCAADILLVELDHCRMVGDYNLVANLVYSADSSVMHTFICNGRVIMEDHHVPGEEEIIADARRCCDKFRR